MAKKPSSKQASGPRKNISTIALVDFKDTDQRPQMAVYAVDRDLKPLHVASVNEEGAFNLPKSAIQEAHRIVIGPEQDPQLGLERESLVFYRPHQFQETLESVGNIDLPRRWWVTWTRIKLCVQGSVKHCQPWPWVLADLTRQSLTRLNVTGNTLQPANSQQETVVQLTNQNLSQSLSIFPRFRCEKICDGLVEVHRRHCCCGPLKPFDPRIPDVIRNLRDLIRETPVIEWPPRPKPDPPPHETGFLKGGALDENALNARRDLAALESLGAQGQFEYLQARPHLFCHCGNAKKVAQGFIQPNGEFHICWWEPIRLMLLNCHDEYAFVVKQVINGTTTTIYDGVAGNRWYHYNQFAELVSYHRDAVTCFGPVFPGAGAFAGLQDIGDTESYHLATPDADGWDRVQVPQYNSGLLFPVATAAQAEGKMKNCNLGGTLKLRYHFSEAMRAMPQAGGGTVNAVYYRISVRASDSNGNPTGNRTYFNNPLSWKKYQVINNDIHVKHEALGPNLVGGEANLYKIPYRYNADWHGGQYHGWVDTTRSVYPQGRYLITLEVFDGNGNRLRPNGSGGPGSDAPFTFRRWYQPTGPTASVNFAALTHMFWWDNRPAMGSLEKLKADATASSKQCQFLKGKQGALFSTEYSAYHPEPRFHLYHRIWWKRGFNGPTGNLTNPTYKPDPVYSGPSETETFANMLGYPADDRCSFAINLHTYVKTHNGSGRLSGYDDWDQGSFALEIIP